MGLIESPENLLFLGRRGERTHEVMQRQGGVPAGLVPSLLLRRRQSRDLPQAAGIRWGPQPKGAGLLR